MKQKQKQILISVVTFLVSFGLVLVIYALVNRDEKLSSEKVLNRAKDSFKEKGPIQGSWIEMTPYDYNDQGQATQVYYGGVTRLENNQPAQYEFTADAYTGEVLKVTTIK